MRLLNSSTKQLELLQRRVPYAIVSHRWGEESEEVLFTDIGDPARTRGKEKGYDKILGSCAQAVRDDLGYVWLDTCCIDKNNSTELSEAINSMYKWYNRSETCYAYLHDVGDPSEFAKSDWFARGWTLQELIAPRVLKFFTKDWTFVGTREDLKDSIAERTGISPDVFRSDYIPQDIPIAQKMFWASKRETTKVEDRAYSLLGILGVSMVPIYGIDDAAFEELQHKIIAKYSDQTLFAWFHTFTPLEDDETEDTGPAPVSAPDSVKDDTPSNTTGLLATSPSQFLRSYEISEQDFRKNYVDPIRDYVYRSYFSFSNNLVHISLPVKHWKGDIWKAVLRCSFEPPDGDQIQRPLVIYLKEVEPYKYVRVHIAPDHVLGDTQPNEGQGIAGSLERLGDNELFLQGYVLRNIDIYSRYGEARPDDQPRQPPSHPDSLPELSEADRIAKLPRHPPGIKTTNVIICGEPGVAVGRVINLIVGDTVIKPLTDYEREAMAATIIDTTLQSKNFRIFYVVGPRDAYLDLQSYHTVIRNTYQLVQLAKESGGIHIVWLCMVGSRFTRAVENNYRLFHDYVCDERVPAMLIITGLGKTRRMEGWWDVHKTDRELQGMRFVDHACITVLRGEDEEHENKYTRSAETVQKMLLDFVRGLETPTRKTRVPYLPEDVDGWFVGIGRRATDLVLHGLKTSIGREALAKALVEGELSETMARTFAGRIVDEPDVENASEIPYTS